MKEVLIEEEAGRESDWKVCVAKRTFGWAHILGSTTTFSSQALCCFIIIIIISLVIKEKIDYLVQNQDGMTD